MKIALLADVHGNLPALQAVLADLEHCQPEILAVAGDLTGGPFSNETIQLLRPLDAQMILGNSDLGLLRYLQGQGPGEWRTHKQFGLLRWNARHLSEANFHFLAALPEQRVLRLPGTDAVCLVHGSPGDPYKGIRPDRDISRLDWALGMIEEPVLVCGHTHEPWWMCRQGKLAVNPGSVAGPLNGETGAQYAVLEWQARSWKVTLKNVPYDFAPLRQAFVDRGLLEEGGAIARGFLLSMETGQDVTLVFLNFANQMAEQAGCQPRGILPDEIWVKAEAEFPWHDWRG